MTAPFRLLDAGSVTEVRAEADGLLTTMVAASGQSVAADVPSGPADVTLLLERSRDPFPTTGAVPVTRGVVVMEDGGVVVERAGGSGFTQLWAVENDRLRVRSRWHPTAAEHVARLALPSRFEALRGQVLLHHPLLWWAAVRGLAPLHVSVLEVEGVVLLLAGPGGVGKSTLVADELAHGARATCDNVGVSDGIVVHGLAEPLRLHIGADARPGPSPRSGVPTTHGRRQLTWHGRVPELRPDLVVVVRRGGASGPALRPITPRAARRVLVAGTFAAGELQRFWPLCAALALATGRGPALAPVEAVAERLTSRLRCVELDLGTRPGAPLRELLARELAVLKRPSRRVVGPR